MYYSALYRDIWIVSRYKPGKPRLESIKGADPLVENRALLPVENPLESRFPTREQASGTKGGPLVPGQEPGLKEDL